MWIHSVPPEIVNSVSDAEKKRQEAINEVIYTERDFVRDMEYLRDVRTLVFRHFGQLLTCLPDVGRTSER